MWRRPRGVLVIRIDRIGDMVLAYGAVRHYPEALVYQSSDALDWMLGRKG